MFCRIGKAERKDMSTGTPEFPGPGAYQAKENFNTGKTAKIGSSERAGLYSREALRNPGPGSYNVSGDIAKGKKYSMGVKYNVKKATEVFPGPGEYDPFDSVYLDKNIGAIIGISERPPLYKKGGVPGPGQYDTRKDLGDGQKPKFGSAKRIPIAKINEEPGPGYYNIPSAIANVQKYLLPYYAHQVRKSTVGENDTSFKGILI